MAESGSRHPRRKAELAKIHIGAKAMGLDRDAYEDLLESLTGKRSSAGVDRAGRLKVLDHMRSKGVRFGRPRGKRRRPSGDGDDAGKSRLLRKIDALLIARGNLPRSYAENILRRMLKHPHRTPLEWATPSQLVKVIQALEISQRRRGRRAGGAA